MAILKRKSQSLVSKINNKLIIHVKRVRLLEIEAVPFCIYCKIYIRYGGMINIVNSFVK